MCNPFVLSLSKHFFKLRSVLFGRLLRRAVL